MIIIFLLILASLIIITIVVYGNNTLLIQKLPSRMNHKVKCETCKHWIDKEDAQKVTTNVVSFTTSSNSMLYYCPMHKKPYTQKLMFIRVDTETKYFGKVEMTEDGTPVGYKKIK